MRVPDIKFAVDVEIPICKPSQVVQLNEMLYNFMTSPLVNYEYYIYTFLIT